MEPEEFGKIIGKLLKDTKKLYIISLVIIFLFPPINRVPRPNMNFFEGWHFITKLGGVYHINLTYIIIEFVIVTVIYFVLKKK